MLIVKVGSATTPARRGGRTGISYVTKIGGHSGPPYFINIKVCIKAVELEKPRSVHEVREHFSPREMHLNIIKSMLNQALCGGAPPIIKIDGSSSYAGQRSHWA